MEILRVKTARRTQLVDVTSEVERAVEKAGAVVGRVLRLRAAYDGGCDD